MSWWHNLPAELKQTGAGQQQPPPGQAAGGAAARPRGTPATRSNHSPPLVADHFVSRLFGKQAAPLGTLVLDKGSRPPSTAPPAVDSHPAEPQLHPVPELKAAALLRKKPKHEQQPQQQKTKDHAAAVAPPPPPPPAPPVAVVEHRRGRDVAEPAVAAAAAADEDAALEKWRAATASPTTRLPPSVPAAARAPPPPPAAAAAPVDTLEWTIRDADRNGSFFLEWRITAPELAEALAKVQKDLLEAAGAKHLVVLQSCAADNLHVTMNEWTMTSAAEARRARDALAEFSETAIVPRLAAGPPAILASVENFNERVWYVPIVGPGLAALQDIYRAATAFLTKKGFKLKPTKGGTGELTAHITLGKTRPATGQPAAIHAAIEALGLKGKEMGRMPVREVVFCVKRRKAEAQPPVLATLPPPPPGAAVPSAPAAAPPVVASALVVMPPKNAWAPFVQIKRRHHDPRLKRPPYPHVTLLAAAPHPSPALSERARRAFGTTAPFTAAFDTFTLFERPRADSATLYLEPRCTLGGSFAHLRQVAVDDVLGKPPQDTFEAHLAVGLVRGLGEARRLKKQYQTAWTPLHFPVREVYHITRVSDDAPWVVAAVYPLSGCGGAPPAVAVGETTDSGFVPA